MLMKRDGLSSRQGLGENEEILSVSDLAVQLDDKWQAAQRTRVVDEVIAVTLLENERVGRGTALRSRRGRVWSGVLFSAHNYPDGSRRKNKQQNIFAHGIPFWIWFQIGRLGY